ncbi:hypothetical protein PQX77_017264 [Marasmius sp. AFHP31]|nr:hypothetical protein PQX77_017264 [Marasmius sp. AFHP31]
MLRLSKNSGLHPTCLSVQNVKRIGEYPVAAGGFGDVWKGTIGDSSELVCLKVVKVYLKSNLEQLTNEYLREAILWRQMKHPNVLPFHGIYRLEHTQQLCLISPWMDNGNLVEFLKATKREDVNHYTLVGSLVYDVTSGLAYLHSRKIVHGDLKGLNILITCLFRACIADFGLSRIIDSKGLRITTSATRPVGTARWLAPELLVGSGGPSKESDIYSYACVCYEIFTGLQPFPDFTNEVTVAFHVAQGKRPSRPEEAPELSDVMWALMNVCWDATPTSRPTAAHVLREVERLTSSSPASDWSESLFTQVWENVEYRPFSPSSPDASKLAVNRSFSESLEATSSPETYHEASLDLVLPSSPSPRVRAPVTSSEGETRADDDRDPFLDSVVKGVAPNTDRLKDLPRARPQVQEYDSLPTPLVANIEPSEVLSSPTRQGPSSFIPHPSHAPHSRVTFGETTYTTSHELHSDMSLASGSEPSPQDPNSCSKEIWPTAGTIGISEEEGVNKDLSDSASHSEQNQWQQLGLKYMQSQNQGQAQRQDQLPAQQAQQRRENPHDDDDLVEPFPNPIPPPTPTLVSSRSSPYGSLPQGAARSPSPHQELPGSNTLKKKNPNLHHHHNNLSKHSILTLPTMGILRVLDPPHARQHLPSAGHPHQAHHHQHTASTDTTATTQMIAPSRPSTGMERYPSMNSLAPSTMVSHDIENGNVRKEIKEKEKDRRVGGWLSRWTGGGRDKDKDHGHGQRERSQSWHLVHPEEQGGELTRLIGFLTATSSEDWALVLDVCERASASDSNAKEAIRALRREFKYGHPQAQLSAARLWAIMLRNSTDTFISQSTSRKFLETLEELSSSSRTNPVVKERVLDVLAAAAYQERVLDVLAAAAYTRGGSKDTGFRGLWKKVKPPDKPDEGIPFDTDDAMFNPPTGADRRSYAESLPYPQPQLHPNHHHIGQQQQYDHQQQQQQQTQQNQNQPPNNQHGKTGDLLPKVNGDVTKESEDRAERRERDPDQEHSSGRERKDSNRERDYESQERDKDKDRERSSHKDKDRESRKRKKHRTSRERERDAQKIIPADEVIQRLFHECIIGKGNASLLSQVLVHTIPENFLHDNADGQGNGIIREFRIKCIASQELIAAQISWASAGSERSRRELNAKLEAEGKPVAGEEEGETTEERLLGDLLNANEDLLAALGQYEDLERVARESKVQADSKNDVGWRRGRDEIDQQLQQEELYFKTGRAAPMGARSSSPSLRPGGARTPSRSPSSSPPMPPPPVPPCIPSPGRSNSRPSSIIIGGGLTSGQHASYSHPTPPPAPRGPRSPGLRGTTPAGLASAGPFGSKSNAGHEYAVNGA